jgi:hypothetical protein
MVVHATWRPREARIDRATRADRRDLHEADNEVSRELHRLAVGSAWQGGHGAAGATAGRAWAAGRTARMSEGTLLALAPWAILISGLAVIGYRLHAYRAAERRRRNGSGEDR